MKARKSRFRGERSAGRWTLAASAAVILGACATFAADLPSPDWRTLVAEGRDAEAAALIETELRENPSDAELWRALGWTYWRLGRLDTAEQLWRRWRGLDEQRVEPHDLLARVYFAESKFEEAIASLRRVLDLQPDHPEAPFLLARALRWAGHLPEAVSRLRALHQQQPENHEILLEMARALTSLWEYDEALAVWTRLREKEPDNLEYMAEEARTSLHAGAVRAATVMAREVLRRDPRNLTALAVMADEAEYGGRPVEALHWLEKWLAVLTDAEDRLYLINRMIAMERTLHDSDPLRWPADRIIARFRQLLAERPDYTEAHLALAEMLIRAARFDEAEILLLRYLREHNINSLRAHSALMQIALARGDFDQAESHFEFLRRFHPENPYNYAHYAAIAHARGDDIAARRALDRLGDAGERGAAAVLLYHALTTSDYGPALSVREFREHIRALQLAGYTLLAPEELRRWWDLHGPRAGLLPDGRIRRAAIVTFDDALENSFRFGTPVALDHGVRFAMHIPVGNIERGDPYIASWDEIRRYAATGAWVFGSHLRFASDLVPVDREGKRRAYAAGARQWLPEQERLETEAEFFARLRDEYRLSREVIEREIGQRARFVAYPYGEIGQEMISNVPDAPPIHLAYARRYYDIGFVQNPVAHATRDADPMLYPRHEFPLRTRGEEVVNYLLDHHPSLLAERMRLQFAAETARPAEARRAIARLRDYGYPQERLAELEAGLRAKVARQFTVPDLDRRVVGARGRVWGARAGVGVDYFENNFDVRRSFWTATAEQIIGVHTLLSAEVGFGRAEQPRPLAPSPIRLEERRARLTLAWVGEDRTVAQAEMGGYAVSGDAERMLLTGALELGGRITPELDVRGRVEREVPEDAAAIAAKVSCYTGTIEAVWSAFSDVDVRFSTELRRYSDGNRRSSLSLAPTYRPLAWRGFYVGARYSLSFSERDALFYWTPEKLDGLYAVAGFLGRWLGGYAGLETQTGLAREKVFAEPTDPAPAADWKPAYGFDLYWSSRAGQRLLGQLQLGYGRTPEYEELRASVRAGVRF